MPHYPDEIEYSDKYYDDLYEYSMLSYQKVYINQCPKKDYFQKMNGDHLEFNKVDVGFIMSFINLNLIFYYLEDL